MVTTPTASRHRETLGKTVRRLRIEREWTLDDLAEKLGVDYRQAVRIEHGEAAPTLDLIENLAAALDIPPGPLLESLPGVGKGLTGQDVASQIERWAIDAFADQWQRAANRPDVKEILLALVALPDDALNCIKVTVMALAHATQCPDAQKPEFFWLVSTPLRSRRRST